MKITVIISVYKNIKSLKLILQSLEYQSMKADEIIVSEDGQFDEIKNFVEELNRPDIIHLTQEDLGWRKNRALNRAIVQASGEYLIFIDGDVIPHKRFIEGHINCSSPKIVCAGKRAELGQEYTKKVYDGELSINEIAKSYLFKTLSLHKDGVRHFEDGIYSPLMNKLTSSRYVRHIIGCNFSCYKEDMEAINGFNEDFVHPAVGEDVDISWRFRGMGIELKSCRYIANQYHLWHKKNFGHQEGIINHKIMDVNIENKQYVCLNGIKKLEKES